MVKLTKDIEIAIMWIADELHYLEKLQVELGVGDRANRRRIYAFLDHISRAEKRLDRGIKGMIEDIKKARGVDLSQAELKQVLDDIDVPSQYILKYGMPYIKEIAEQMKSICDPNGAWARSEGHPPLHIMVENARIKATMDQVSEWLHLITTALNKAETDLVTMREDKDKVIKRKLARIKEGALAIRFVSYDEFASSLAYKHIAGTNDECAMVNSFGDIVRESKNWDKFAKIVAQVGDKTSYVNYFAELAALFKNSPGSNQVEKLQNAINQFLRNKKLDKEGYLSKKKLKKLGPYASRDTQQWHSRDEKWNQIVDILTPIIARKDSGLVCDIQADKLKGSDISIYLETVSYFAYHIKQGYGIPYEILLILDIRYTFSYSSMGKYPWGYYDGMRSIGQMVLAAICITPSAHLRKKVVAGVKKLRCYEQFPVFSDKFKQLFP